MKARLAAYWELTKPRLTALVIFTVWLGYALAPDMGKNTPLFVHTILGSWILAAAGAVLNQHWERDVDALMERTKRRPLPQGRVTPGEALFVGLVLAAIGFAELSIFVNWLTSLLGLFTLVTYVWVYTPLKRKTSLCTIVGAVPGAIPPMMGWAAVTNHVSVQAWVLFGILFLWQLPHFLAIAWMYRDDYARAGFPMLPVIDREGGITARMIILYTTILIPVTILPSHLGVSGFSYGIGAVCLGAIFLVFGARTAIYRTTAEARRLLLASVIYLPSLLTWMACSRPA
jgi:protoheme IX farnesyltransferase